MDKRFLIFAFLTGLALIFFNQWQSSKKEKEQAAYQEQSYIQKEERRLEKEADIKARTAPLSALPLLPVYSAEEGGQITWAVECGPRSYLLTSWNGGWEEKLVIEGQRAERIETDDHFALYSSAKEPRLTAALLPTLGTHDVQIALLGSSSSPTITLGEYDEGELFFPKAFPEKQGVVLYKVGAHYLPAGVYQSKERRFLPLAALTHFTPFIHYESGEKAPKEAGEGEHFILENKSVQLVFSTIGGALSEINLPFRSDTDKESVVLPIQLDRTIEKEIPSNARFPSRPSYRFNVERKQAEIMTPELGGYYPLLRRGISKGGDLPPFTLSPEYYALNILSEERETAEALYTVTQFNEEMIEMEATFSNRKIIKTYHLPKEGYEAPYCFDLFVHVEGDTRGLYLSSGIPEVELISGSAAPAIKYATVRAGKRAIEKLSLPKSSTTLSSFQPDWVSNSNGYFTLILDPLSEIGMGLQANQVPGNLDPSRLTLIDAARDLYPASKYPGYQLLLPLKRSPKPMHFRIYAGPSDKEVLAQVDRTYTNPVTGYQPHYTETQSFHGYFAFISEPFAKFLYFILKGAHRLTHSWGFSIILLTLVLRLLMYPLNAWSIKSTLKLQEVSPELQKIQAKYKKDPKRAQLEVMAFYKKHKVNPFGGCLPLIIQMPFLFGMFDLLKSTFSLRGASFIPGWIDNLTAPDLLFSWSYPIPFIGNGFHLLPLLLGVVMFFQQKMAAAQNKLKGELTEQQKQQQKMGIMMTILFTFLFYKFPSGLNLYWLSSMGLQMGQQYLMSKMKQRKKDSTKRSKEIEITPSKK